MGISWLGGLQSTGAESEIKMLLMGKGMTDQEATQWLKDHPGRSDWENAKKVLLGTAALVGGGLALGAAGAAGAGASGAGTAAASAAAPSIVTKVIGAIGKAAPIINTGLAIGSGIEGIQNQNQSNQLTGQALASATDAYNAKAPVRTRAIQMLSDTSRPDLSRVFADPGDPYAVAHTDPATAHLPPLPSGATRLNGPYTSMPPIGFGGTAPPPPLSQGTTRLIDQTGQMPYGQMPGMGFAPVPPPKTKPILLPGQ